MNKNIVKMSLAVVGSAAFQMTCPAQGSMSEQPKLWNVSASLRGFYDDNYATGNSKRGSYGIEFSPTISANIPLTQTQVGLQYTYGLQYYEARDHINVNAVDQNHSFNFYVDHAFNERWQAKVNDAFTIGQEPELTSGGVSGASATPFRLNGNNISNGAGLLVHADWTRQFSTEFTYGNNFFDYDNLIYSGELNRDQNTAGFNLQWHIAPETTVYAGYAFGIVNYTANRDLGAKVVQPGDYFSADRDNYTQNGHVGVTHNLLANLSLNAEAGIDYNDAYNNPVHETTSVSPSANVSLIYTYIPGCNAQVGFNQSRNATDVAAINTSNGSLTQDQESSTLYASINHHFTPKLLTSIIGKWSESTFNGGPDNNQSDTQYSLGLNANYAFTRNLSGEIGYNYDNLSSPIGGRAYERNRFYIGMTVAY